MQNTGKFMDGKLMTLVSNFKKKTSMCGPLLQNFVGNCRITIPTMKKT